LSQVTYAYVKLGAPEHVPEDLRPPVWRLLAHAARFLGTQDALSSLTEKGLRRVLLSLVLPALPCESSSGVGADIPVSWRMLLTRGLSALLPCVDGDVDPKVLSELRLVVAAARLEFGLSAEDLGSSMAAARFAALSQQPSSQTSAAPRQGGRMGAGASAGGSATPLVSYDRSVHDALARLLKDWPLMGEAGGPPSARLAVLHRLAAFDVRLAVPEWRAAVEVAHPKDIFALSSSGFTGWELSAPRIQWHRIPELRIRLLRRMGWHVVEVPFYEWRRFVDGLEQRQFLQAELSPVASAAAETAAVAQERSHEVSDVRPPPRPIPV